MLFEYDKQVGNILTFKREELDKVPGISGLYILFNRAGYAIYVGQSENIKKRVRSSLRQTDGSYDYKKTHEAEYIQCFEERDETERLILEILLIGKLRPLYNINGLSMPLEERKAYQDEHKYIQAFRKSIGK